MSQFQSPQYTSFVTYGLGHKSNIAVASAMRRVALTHLQFTSGKPYLSYDAQEVPLSELHKFPVGATLPAVISQQFAWVYPHKLNSDIFTICGASLFFYPCDENFVLLVNDEFHTEMEAVKDDEQYLLKNYVEKYISATNCFLGLFLNSPYRSMRHLISAAGIRAYDGGVRVFVYQKDSKNLDEPIIVKDVTKEQVSELVVCLLAGVIIHDYTNIGR